MNLQERFESKFSIPNNSCWVWHGYIDNGVPMFPVKRRYRSARQIALQIYTGTSVPAGHVACAKCGNSLCVNPDHTEIVPRSCSWGPHGKLTTQDVSEIRELLAKGNLTHREIAEHFGVSRVTVTHINTGRNWK